MKQFLVAALLAICAACGSSSPSAPSSSTTTTPPAPTTFNLSGTITSAGGGGIAATLNILDGPNAGRSATANSSGAYSFTGLTGGGFTIAITANGFVTQNRGVTLISDSTLSVALLPSQVFSQSGVGDNVFTIPAYVTRVRVDATYGGTCQNFIVNANSRLLINIIIGTCSVADTKSPFSGTYAVSGATQIAITSSTGIAWTFTELR
jgi:hypothetical protein